MKTGDKLRSLYLPVVFIITGIVFMSIGIDRGEMAVVLRKAINICLECIGIG